MSDTQSPLAGLVLFIVCLAIAGTCVAGVHYVVIDHPAQVRAEQEQPENGWYFSNGCRGSCSNQYPPGSLDLMRCIGRCPD